MRFFTKPISWQTYCPNPRVPKLLTAQDLIKYHADREAEVIVESKLVPIPEFHKERVAIWSIAAAYAFGVDVIKSILP